MAGIEMRSVRRIEIQLFILDRIKFVDGDSQAHIPMPVAYLAYDILIKPEVIKPHGLFNGRCGSFQSIHMNQEFVRRGIVDSQPVGGLREKQDAPVALKEPNVVLQIYFTSRVDDKLFLGSKLKVDQAGGGIRWRLVNKPRDADCRSDHARSIDSRVSRTAGGDWAGFGRPA